MNKQRRDELRQYIKTRWLPHSASVAALDGPLEREQLIYRVTLVNARPLMAFKNGKGIAYKDMK